MIHEINSEGEHLVFGGTFCGRRLSPGGGRDRVGHEAALLQYIRGSLGVWAEHLCQWLMEARGAETLDSTNWNKRTAD